MVIFCVLVVVKVRYGSKFIYFLSILFLQLKKFIQCFNYIYFLQGYCYVTFVHGNQGIFGILQFFWLFCTVLCHFIFFIAVILLSMHFTELCSCITLFILLYQCVHYHQCNYLLVNKHFSFAECSIDFFSCNFLFQYFSSNICITIGVSSQHNFSFQYYFVKYYNCSKVVCSLSTVVILLTVYLSYFGLLYQGLVFFVNVQFV